MLELLHAAGACLEGAPCRAFGGEGLTTPRPNDVQTSELTLHDQRQFLNWQLQLEAHMHTALSWHTVTATHTL